jgi:hypothetical protein
MIERQEKKDLDVRFKRSENTSADTMAKNRTRDVYEKHTKSIRKGTLEFWKEDVKQDSSVNEVTKSRAFSSSPTSSSLASSFTSESRTPKGS